MCDSEDPSVSLADESSQEELEGSGCHDDEDVDPTPLDWYDKQHSGANASNAFPSDDRNTGSQLSERVSWEHDCDLSGSLV